MLKFLSFPRSVRSLGTIGPSGMGVQLNDGILVTPNTPSTGPRLFYASQGQAYVTGTKEDSLRSVGTLGELNGASTCNRVEDDLQRAHDLSERLVRIIQASKRFRTVGLASRWWIPHETQNALVVGTSSSTSGSTNTKCVESDTPRKGTRQQEKETSLHTTFVNAVESYATDLEELNRTLTTEAVDALKKSTRVVLSSQLPCEKEKSQILPRRLVSPYMHHHQPRNVRVLPTKGDVDGSYSMRHCRIIRDRKTLQNLATLMEQCPMAVRFKGKEGAYVILHTKIGVLFS